MFYIVSYQKITNIGACASRTYIIESKDAVVDDVSKEHLFIEAYNTFMALIADAKDKLQHYIDENYDDCPKIECFEITNPTNRDYRGMEVYVHGQYKYADSYIINMTPITNCGI